MNYVLCSFITKLMVTYFDNFLIYSKSESERVEHLRCLLQALKDKQLYANLEKCYILF